MLSCTEISFVISLFNFEKFWVNPGFPFTQLNRANTQNLERKKIILTCFTKMIAEQSSVIQYALPMYDMKEK